MLNGLPVLLQILDLGVSQLDIFSSFQFPNIKADASSFIKALCRLFYLVLRYFWKSSPRIIPNIVTLKRWE